MNGIRHMTPVIHGPKGCTYSVGSAYKMRGCEYRGVPFEPTTCTANALLKWRGTANVASVPSAFAKFGVRSCHCSVPALLIHRVRRSLDVDSPLPGSVTVWFTFADASPASEANAQDVAV